MLARRRSLEVAGRAVAIHDGGEGPPVLLLHGSGPGTTAQAWAPLAAALGPHHRLIAPDLPGFGESDRVPLGDESPWVEWAGAVLDAVGVSECAVVGNSAGGALALGLACARPRAVTRVVVVGSMGFPMPLPDGLDKLWSFTPSWEAAREVLSLLFAEPAAGTHEAIEARVAAMEAQPDYASLFPAPRQRWVDALSLPVGALASIAAPVLLIHGSHD